MRSVNHKIGLLSLKKAIVMGKKKLKTYFYSMVGRLFQQNIQKYQMLGWSFQN